MAWIFQKVKEKGQPYFFEYTDHLGDRRQKKGFADKRETERLAAEYEKKAKLRREGLLDPADEKFAEERQKPLTEHLTDYEASLKAKRRSEKHIRLTLSRIRKVFDGCRYRMITDFDALEVEQQLSKLSQKDGHGPRTFNHYLQSVSGFCNWMIKAQRMRSNPFSGLTPLNTKVDIRHTRRALTPAEISKVVDAAFISNVRVQGYDGWLRAMAYLLSYYTGLRQKELSALTPSCFRMNGEAPVVILDAKCTKNGEPAEIPLHPELLHLLQEWLPTLALNAPLFPRFAHKKAWLMIKKDLARVGIPYENEDGIADFHAAGRVSYVTHLLKNGATLAEVKNLARHSDIRMTAKYAKASREDQRQTLNNLPQAPVSSQFKSRYSVRPESPAVSTNGYTKAPRQRAAKSSESGSSVSEGEQGSGVGDACHQPRKKWRRRESNEQTLLGPKCHRMAENVFRIAA